MMYHQNNLIPQDELGEELKDDMLHLWNTLKFKPQNEMIIIQDIGLKKNTSVESS